MVESRIDISANTRLASEQQRQRALPFIGERRIDAVQPSDVADLVGAVGERGAGRETVKKSKNALAQTFDHAGIEPNPFRSKQVRLPRGGKPRIPPPIALHVEAVIREMARLPPAPHAHP